MDFRRYIQQENSSTIPLTFNVRQSENDAWRMERDELGAARLVINKSAGKVLTQVDCQHRLGYLNDLDLPLPFMCYVGLNEREEKEVFTVINSKAKGLSASLLDFHNATLAADMAADRPELYVALYLNNEGSSPWHRQLNLGGKATSGMMRRASLRTMQTAIKRFLDHTRILHSRSADSVAQMVLDFWNAVALVLQEGWNDRRTLICKGVGVHALMGIAIDLVLEAGPTVPDKKFFCNKLTEFLPEIDWRTKGHLSGLGGQGGVKKALGILRAARGNRQILQVVNG
jgi:DGQHR domain-containing protein